MVYLYILHTILDPALEFILHLIRTIFLSEPGTVMPVLDLLVRLPMFMDLTRESMLLL